MINLFDKRKIAVAATVVGLVLAGQTANAAKGKPANPELAAVSTANSVVDKLIRLQFGEVTGQFRSHR